MPNISMCLFHGALSIPLLLKDVLPLNLPHVFQEQFSEVLDAMFEVLVKPQEHIIDQGEDGDNFYVIEK